ncbi:MAG: hypothetical protein ACT4OF_08610 [Caulobacteraceae bacterium]
MLTCLALALSVSFAELPALAAEVETGARELTLQTEITPALLTSIEEFSTDAERLSVSLRDLGVEQDLPCIFHGIAEDARERVVELRGADTPPERDSAFTNLRALLDDAILIAPIAASAAADRAADRHVASR